MTAQEAIEKITEIVASLSLKDADEKLRLIDSVLLVDLVKP